MERIALKNLKTENAIALILLLGLGSALFYWGLYTKVNIRVSGAKMGHEASTGLLFILGSIMFVMAIAKLINLLSLAKHGKLEVVLGPDRIVLPVHKAFQGYSKLEVPKGQLGRVTVVEHQRNDFTLYLNNEQGYTLASIPGGIIPYDKIMPVGLANKILEWINKN